MIEKKCGTCQYFQRQTSNKYVGFCYYIADVKVYKDICGYYEQKRGI